MAEILYSTSPDQVEWLMKWTKTKPSKEKDELVFEPELALAVLLINGKVHLNNFWWEKGLPPHMKDTISIHVICNDLFMWGCADSEDLKHSDIEPVYKAYIADPVWGIDIWCCKRRNMQPQPPVKKSMRDAGVWSDELEALPKNPFDRPVEAKP